MRIWLNDIRPAPEGYLHCRSVNEAKAAIRFYERNYHDDRILINLGHDSGDDYIKLLDWLEKEGIVDTGYLFHLHARNAVGAENMRRIIRKNKWKEI